MKINLRTMKNLRKLLIILLAISLNACKKDNSKESKKEDLQHSGKSISEKEIDTSYKKNIKLFENYYYLMPENLISKFGDETIISCKGVDYTFHVTFEFKGKLLKEVQLYGESYEGLHKIIALYSDKYGTPKTDMRKETYNSNDLYVKNIIKITDPIYDSSKHKKISNINNLDDLEKTVYASKFIDKKNKIYRDNNNYYYVLMMDVTQNVAVPLMCEVNLEKFYYTRNMFTKTYEWENNGKIISIDYYYKNEYIGYKNAVQEEMKSLNISYSSIQDKNKKDSSQSDELEKERKEKKEKEQKTKSKI